jgi:hypothetical protein
MSYDNIRDRARQFQATKAKAMRVRGAPFYGPRKASDISGQPSTKTVPYPKSIAGVQNPDTDGYRNDSGVAQSWVTGRNENGQPPNYDGRSKNGRIKS